MADKEIVVYIEGEGGGGTTGKRHYLDGEFRKAWKEFLQPLADRARQRGIWKFRCIPGRGGSATGKQFANPLPEDAGALRILLIDSEGPVNNVATPWAVVKQKRPDWASDKDCYLMVQCLESWLLADVETLREYYNSRGKACFRENKIKAWQELEKIPRKTLQDSLEAATTECGRPYGHADGNVLIGKVRREKLETLSSVARLFKDFAQRIDEYAAQ